MKAQHGPAAIKQTRRSALTVLTAAAAVICLCGLALAQTTDAPGGPQKTPAPVEGLQVRILAPTASDFLGNRTRIVCFVKPSPGAVVAAVEFFVDGVRVFTDTEEPYEHVYKGFEDDLSGHLIKVTARDSSGAAAEDTVETRAIEVTETEEVILVEMYATVQDNDKRPVRGLKREDFEVMEDKHPQEIAFFSNVAKPLCVAILIDTSGSMEENIYQAQEAAVNFVYQGLRDTDEAMIVTFDSRVRLTQELTTDRRKLEKAILKTTTGGATVMYDSIAAATHKLNQFDNSRRKAIVLVSDGQDEGSTQTQKSVEEYVKKSDVTVYALGIELGPPLMPGLRSPRRRHVLLPARDDLESFTKVSGGETFMIDDLEDIKGVYEKIGDELRNQYNLAYYSKNHAKDGKWRKITVKAGDHDVRTRKGYYAPYEPAKK